MSTAGHSSLDEYYAERAALVHKDRSLRRENARHEYLTKDERRADEVVRTIRAREAESVWEDESIPNMFPGMGFLTAKAVIDKTQCFKLIKKMPKGGLLHAHLDACLNKDLLLKLAYGHKEIHVSVRSGLTAQNSSLQLPSFRPFRISPFSGGNASLSANQGYKDGSWIPILEARNSFDPSFGGPEGFDKWIIGSQTINPAEAYGTHNSVKKIWEKFSDTFIPTTGLFYYQPIYRKYVRQALYEFIEDGISYMEVRINFLPKFMRGEDCEETVPHRQWIEDFERIVVDVKAELAAQGRGDDFYGAKIIYSTIRFISPEELEWYTEDAISLKKAFPKTIVGFDLVGNENTLRPLADYLPQLLSFKGRVHAERLDLPLILHAGETLSDGGPPDANLYDALTLGSKRIGHGYSLVKHPELLRICREREIAIEVCPISNEILRLTTSMPAHPLPILINNGVPACLNSDDPAVFGSMGLSYDFYQVLVSSEVSGLLTLAQLARDSLQYSTLKPDEKEDALKNWERRWAKYVKEITTRVD